MEHVVPLLLLLVQANLKWYQKIQSDKGIRQILMHESLARVCVRLFVKIVGIENVFERPWVPSASREIKFKRESFRTGANSLPGCRAVELEVLYVGYTSSLFEKNA